MEEKTMPVHVMRLGKIQASVWRNDTKHGPRFNVTVCRLYQENGDWKRSDSFGRDELLTTAKALTDAYEWIWEQANEANESENEKRKIVGEELTFRR